MIVFAREVIILELKMDDAPTTPQAQASRQAYPARYTHEGKTVHIWGIVVGRTEREILEITSRRYEAQAQDDPDASRVSAPGSAERN